MCGKQLGGGWFWWGREAGRVTGSRIHVFVLPLSSVILEGRDEDQSDWDRRPGTGSVSELLETWHRAGFGSVSDVKGDIFTQFHSELRLFYLHQINEKPFNPETQSRPGTRYRVLHN